MRALVVVAILAVSTWVSPAWALFESNKELSATAQITLDEAVKTAVKALPGKAVEAQIGKEDGRTVYEVEIIDSNKKTRTVYVDAQTGALPIEIEEDPVMRDYDYLRVIGATVLAGAVAVASQNVSDHMLWGPLKATASEPAPGQVFKVVNKDQFQGKWKQFKGGSQEAVGQVY
jgi:hypothetical protein